MPKKRVMLCQTLCDDDGDYDYDDGVCTDDCDDYDDGDDDDD